MAELDRSVEARGVIAIRSGVVGDVQAMARIINYYAGQGQMLPRSHHQLYQFIRDFLIATVDGALVGCGAMHVVWGDLGEVRSLAVSENWKGRGVGRCLVNALLDQASDLGLPRVFALTYQQAFFESLGFRTVPREHLPHKIWGDCLDCPKFPNCDEIALMIELDTREENDEG